MFDQDLLAEIDYKAMFEAMAERVRSLYEADEEYFSLLASLSDLTRYVAALNGRIFKLPKTDQIAYLRALTKTGDVARDICEKHDIPVEPAEDE